MDKAFTDMELIAVVSVILILVATVIPRVDNSGLNRHASARIRSRDRRGQNPA
jgi:hypothetical protein